MSFTVLESSNFQETCFFEQAGRIPKRDGTAERARSVASKVERERSLAPSTSAVDLSVTSELLPPTVSCSNMPMVPSTSKVTEHPVVAGKCSNCFCSATSSAHARVGIKQFESKESLALFERMLRSADDDAQIHYNEDRGKGNQPRPGHWLRTEY